jgi:hypothetical protein
VTRHKSNIIFVLAAWLRIQTEDPQRSQTNMNPTWIGLHCKYLHWSWTYREDIFERLFLTILHFAFPFYHCLWKHWTRFILAHKCKVFPIFVAIRICRDWFRNNWHRNHIENQVVKSTYRVMIYSIVLLLLTQAISSVISDVYVGPFMSGSWVADTTEVHMCLTRIHMHSCIDRKNNNVCLSRIYKYSCVYK